MFKFNKKFILDIFVLITVPRKYQSNINVMRKVEDNRLQTFHRLCDEIAEVRSYNSKAKILKNFIKNGSDGRGFNGDLFLWMQMLIPSSTQRVYNLQNKQMLKLFSRLFDYNLQEMQLDLEQEGDVSETLRKFFQSSTKLRPQIQSTLYLHDVEEFLINLEKYTKEEEQSDLLRAVCKQTTAMDLKMIIRLIKQDLRINAGARHILDALDPLAYPAYQTTRDLSAVVHQFASNDDLSQKVSLPGATKIEIRKTAKIGKVNVFTPISPMLANACRSVEEAFKKSPGGLYGEVKYDGERVQIHKHGNEFKFFSRNLKPVMDHKIKRFKEFIPKAFPGAFDMILDSEIILVDMESGELLPFGTLGAHKKKEHVGAEVCIYVFDCIYFNGEDLTNLVFRERRKILEDNIHSIKSYVQLSESYFLKTKNELSVMTAKVLRANLEGIVLKIPNSTYQPGKRGWLKVKKDYLFGGKMADTADLVVLGAWFGSGKKGGMLSIFLMGCYDPRDRLWKTVTKVHSGLDDATNEEIHNKLMELMDRSDLNKLPYWFLCKRTLVPDYIAQSPDKMPVWEITGAEFTKSEAHTAAGISIRFPRITKIREDKLAVQANDLPYLQKLYEASKKDVNVDLLIENCDNDENFNDLIDSKLSIYCIPQQSEWPKPGTSKSFKRNVQHDVKLKETAVDIRNTLLIPKNKKRKTTKFDSEEKSLKKQLQINVGVDLDNPNVECNIFDDVTAYFQNNIVDEKYFQKFIDNGGKITKDPKEANYIFYETANVKVNIVNCRNKYKKMAFHLSMQWIHDSLRLKKCLPFPMYAVVL